ncbi:DMT family transporter [Pseudohalocynthiibacter aestuariivivens]|uniref:DMT family transporter n=1 Tax=Roseovarius pelagicus TaxID=2980108 RepID=A0ABY6DHS2_9RHOB|nr:MULTISPECIES: DMT family transporter [Rhodobacterales]QIE44728.1 DMT family transporter [Pseudohalocynthiibacter aestuariivivens]UXX83360.1 DMT family transporter [Roseovarius pelagicus]
MEWRDNLHGGVLMVFAMAGFAVEDYFIKLLSDAMPVGQLLAMLGTAGALIFGISAQVQGQSAFSRVAFSKPVMLRNVGELIAAVGYVTAIALTSLSSAAAILQATPLAVTLGAALFMGAAVGWRRWAAILIGFMGVLMIIRPGLEGFEPASLWAVMGVVGLAIRDLATRAAPANVSTMQMSCYAFAIMLPTGLLMLTLSGGAVTPEPRDWAILGGAMVFGVVGYYAIVGAMRIGDVAVVTPFRYSRLIFALLLGMLLLGERPDDWTLIGAAVIIASGLYTFVRERRLARRQKTG